MEPFSTHRGILATLNRANVDTDQIIPKQFLKSIKRTGFGVSLFFDWRYGGDGNPDPDFELNAPAFDGASILVTRNNFGCGSSREHAVWACAQYGLRVIIAPFRGEGNERIPGFADIFRNNSVKNGLLTVELTEDEVEQIFALVARFPGLEATVDLDAQQVVLQLDDTQPPFRFEIDPGVKEHLGRGLDDIALTLEHQDEITAFEAGHDLFLAKG
jgi:3-isopropylmalate/(R)-2-methylmalate dehydratase small subunit